MFKRIVCFLTLCFIMVCIPINVSATERYKWIKSTDMITLLYDTQTVKYIANEDKTVDVWILLKYTPDGAMQVIGENRANGGFKGEKWDNFSYIQEHLLFNSKRQCKLLMYLYCDTNSRVIESYNLSESKWEDVVPGSVGEDVYNTFYAFLESK